MNIEMQLKTTILAMVMEWETDQDPLEMAKEMFAWVMESQDTSESKISELRPVN